ncbi:MAG: AI-2E family transporter [Anaerolineales bacterium]|nr:AI-2E family transporter [Anaerolineales bacterium]
MFAKPWSRTTRILVVVGGIIGLIWLLIAVNPLVQSVVAAALLAYLFDPLVRWLQNRTRLDRTWSARIVYGGLLILIIGMSALLSTVAYNQYANLEADFLEAVAQIQEWLTQPIIILGVQMQPLAIIDNVVQQGSSALSTVPGGAFTALLGVSTNLLWALTILVTFYYFLVDGPQIKPWLVDLFPPDYQPELHILIDEIDVLWRLFLRAQLIIFAIFFALLGGGIVLVIWLFRSGLLPLSPVGLVVLLLVVYAIVQNIDNVIVRPYFFGESLQLHPGVVFVGLIGGLVYGGVLGVIIVIPLIATAKIVGLYVRRRLMGLPPFPEPEAAEGEAEVKETP